VARKTSPKKKPTARKKVAKEDEYIEIHPLLPRVRKRVFKKIGKKVGALNVRLYRKLHGWSRSKEMEDAD
jgi:hypothetical protein